MTELLDTLVSYFTTNWTAANTSSRTPSVFGKKNDYKRIDVSFGDHVLFYYESAPSKERNSFGYDTVSKTATVAVDIWTGYSDAHSQLMLAEVERLVANLRKNSSINGGYDLIEPARVTDLRDSVRLLFRWLASFDFLKTNEAITV